MSPRYYHDSHNQSDGGYAKHLHRINEKNIFNIRHFIIFSICVIIVIHLYLLWILHGKASSFTLTRDKKFFELDNFQLFQKEVIPSEAELTLEEAKSYKIASVVSPVDKNYFSIRINTWKRNDQLIIAVNQHAKCEGVLKIYIIWCDLAMPPPPELTNHVSGKVIIEYHEQNSLNARFHILKEPPTLAILSIDDDLIYPCAALDAGFVRWRQAPHRMIGYDARSHSLDFKKYAYQSTTYKSNQYSLTLPRACFLHKDYFTLYIRALPRPVLNYVKTNFNCEDIAMSFFTSYINHGEPPLLVNYWATKTRTKLFVEKKISGGKNHKALRDTCIDLFAELLYLKNGTDALKYAELFGDKTFGFQPHVQSAAKVAPNRYLQVLNVLGHSKKDYILKYIKSLIMQSQMEAKEKGFIEHTPEWEKKWNK